MKLFLQIALIIGVIGWAVSKFYFQIDTGLVKALVLFMLPCYVAVVLFDLNEAGKTPK